MKKLVFQITIVDEKCRRPHKLNENVVKVFCCYLLVVLNLKLLVNLNNISEISLGN